MLISSTPTTEQRIAEPVPSGAKEPGGPPECHKKQTSLSDVGQVFLSERKHGGDSKRSHESQDAQITGNETQDQAILKHGAKDSKWIGVEEVPEHGVKEGGLGVTPKECLPMDDHRYGLEGIPKVISVECVPENAKHGSEDG